MLEANDWEPEGFIIHEGARGLGTQESNVSLPPQSFRVEAIRL